MVIMMTPQSVYRNLINGVPRNGDGARRAPQRRRGKLAIGMSAAEY